MSTHGDITFWQAVRLVAGRELRTRGRDRSFVISTLVSLLVIGAIIVLPKIMGADRPPSYDVAFTGTHATAMADAAAAQAKTLGVTLKASTSSDPQAARAKLESGKLDAVVTDQQIEVNKSVPAQLGALLQSAHQQVAVPQQLSAAGLDPQRVGQALQVAPLHELALHPKDPDAESRKGVAFIGTVILYAQLLGYGMWVAMGVVEEKSSRVVEVLLSSVPTRALLTGKILGIGLLGLGQLALIVAVSLGIAAVSGVATITAGMVASLLVVVAWFILGYAFYAALYAAAGARVSSQEELQNVTGPATSVILVSFFAAMYASNNPDTVVTRVLALVPPFSALVNPPRMVSGDGAWWEVAVAVVLMVAAVTGLIAVATRMYEGAVLRMGAKVTMREAWRAGRGAEPASKGVEVA